MNIFKLKQNNTNIKTEILAGLTTFSSMMYILVVNPNILAQAMMPAEAVFAATIFASAIMTIAMGLLTNLPLALAPGMGLNAFFTYTICIGKGIPWEGALGIVFYSGILFLILTFSGLRKKIFQLIPTSIRIGLTVGIGLFITLIGLKNAQIIVPHPATILSLGDVGQAKIMVIFIGIILASVLHVKKVSASLLISMLFIFVSYLILGESKLPSQLFSAAPNISQTMFKLDLQYFWNNWQICLPLVLSLFFVDLFDNMGTLMAVTNRAKLLDESGNIQSMNKALKADAVAAIVGSVLGTSSVTSYIESATGVEQGGRTGLVSIVVAICFLLSMFFSPLILAIPLAATTPALVMVGYFMMSEIKQIDFNQISSALPAFFTIIMIPFSFSIAEGFGLGMIIYFLIYLINKITSRS